MIRNRTRPRGGLPPLVVLARTRFESALRKSHWKSLRAGLVFPVTLLVVASMFLVPAAFGQSAKTTLTDPVLAQRFNDVSDRLMCQCSCQMILRVCNHVNCPSAVPMRQSIEKQLLEGKTDDEIVQGFVDEIGIKVLSAPPVEGFNLAAWVMPGFALLVGLFIAGYVASRWAARRRAATAEATTVDVDPEIQKRIEEEIRTDQL